MENYFFKRIVALLVLSLSVVSAENLKVEHLSNYSGEYNDFVIENNFAFLLKQDKLVTIDLGGLGALEEMDYSLGNENYVIAANGNRAYAFNECKFKTYDITDPYSPFEIFQIDTFNNKEYQCGVFDIDIYDDSAILTYLVNGKYIEHEKIDLSEVSEENDSKINSSRNNSSIVKNEYLIYSYNYWALGINGVGIKDIKDINNNLSTYVINENPSIVSYIDGLALSDDYFYVSYSDSEGNDGFDIVDISDPENPEFIDFYKTTSNILTIKDNYLYLSDNGKINIFDVTDPQNIVEAVSIEDFDFGNIINLILEDNKIYVLSDRGFDIFSIKPVFPDPDLLPQEFIKKLYINILERAADEGGLQYWDEQLKTTMTAKEVVKFFFNSSEFVNADIDEGEFLNRLYKTILEREPDEEGYNYWIQEFQNGVSREEAIDEFLNSDEFYALAVRYGLNP